LEVLSQWANVHKHPSVGGGDVERAYGAQLTVVGGTPTVVEMTSILACTDATAEVDGEGRHSTGRPVLLPR
jgi:hypothetical protein